MKKRVGSIPIRRKTIASLMMLALLTSCASGSSTPTPTNNNAPASSPPSSAKSELIHYSTVEQCEAGTQVASDEYNVLVEAFRSGALKDPPTKPALLPEDCVGYIEAALAEYQETAAVYESMDSCLQEDVQCEPTPPGSPVIGFRPVFGGVFYDPFSPPIFVGGGYYPRPIYVYNSLSSRTTFVTVSGHSVKVNGGRATAPSSHVSTTPTRTTKHSATGSLRGRGSRGFGSTFKSTGRGGK